jgi:hypothetical protein
MLRPSQLNDQRIASFAGWSVGWMSASRSSPRLMLSQR